MKDAKRIISEARELQDFAIKRGHEVLKARNINYKVYVDGISTYADELSVKFIEDTGYDEPDMEYVRLTSSELDMEEGDWHKHLDAIKSATEIEKAKTLKEREDTREARKKAQDDRWNRMFGDFPNAKP